MLSIESAVFKALLDNPSRLKINISDVKFEVMREVLRFLYIGEIEEDDLKKSDGHSGGS